MTEHSHVDLKVSKASHQQKMYLQVMEWQKVAEDWIRAGRQLMVLHYEEVTTVLSVLPNGISHCGGIQDFIGPTRRGPTNIRHDDYLNDRWSMTQ